MIEKTHQERGAKLPPMEAINGLLAAMRDRVVACERCQTARAHTIARRSGKASLICRGCADGGQTARAETPKPLRPYAPLFHRPARAAALPSAPVVGTITRPVPFRSRLR